MISTSALYHTILSGPHTKEVKLNIAGADYGMDVLTSLRTSLAPFGSGSPTIGLASAGEISASLRLASSQVPRMATLRPFVRLVNGTQQSEWLPQGVYYVDTRQADASGVLTLHGYDGMLRADRPAPYSTLQWPALDADVVAEICSILGLTVDSRTAALMTSGFRIPLPAQYTMRETLRYIAALYGGSFILTASNALRLLPLWQRGSSADHDLTASVQSISVSPAFPACTGVRFLTEDGAEFFAGNEIGYVYEISSPFATQAAANALLTRMQGFVYRPYAAEGAILNPAAEPGDTVSISSGNTTALSSLFSISRTFDSLFPADAAAPEDEELDHEYPYESSADRTYTRKLQNMQSELSVQAQAISAKVSRSGGDASSFGWYLDADRFSLMSAYAEVLRCDQNGLTVNGTVTATAGSIGGCDIENGTLKIANANIENLNASKIDDYTIESGNLDDGSVVNRVLGSSSVSYGKTSFQSTLDQVGTNKANIDVLYGYFTGYAHFSQLEIDTGFYYGGKTIGISSATIGGRTIQYLGWV